MRRKRAQHEPLLQRRIGVHRARICAAAIAVTALGGCGHAVEDGQAEGLALPAAPPSGSALLGIPSPDPGGAQGGPEVIEPQPCVAACFDIERCDTALGTCVPACPQGEVYIPRTDPTGFIMGRGISAFGYGARTSEVKGHGRSDVPHRVVLTRPFCMDATEVTAAAMLDCVKERGCRPPGRTDRWSTYMRFPDHPVNMVNYNKAKHFCEQYGKSLPTEAQWEWAATGGDSRKWPWGDEEPTCERADFTAKDLVSPGGDSGCHGGGPSRVGAHPKGDREWPSGRISDLAGNVWEWVLDSYLPYEGKDEVDPLHLNRNIGNHVVRGGGWNRSARGILATFRAGAIMTYQVPGLGFRCVRNPKPLPDASSR